MTSKLIRGRQVIYGVGIEGEPLVVDDGAVLVCDGLIQSIGPFSQLEQECEFDDLLGGPEHVIFPGLVNAHHHLGITPLQHGSPDLPLELWIVDLMGARNVDPYLDTLYSAFELVRSGVTTVQHLPYPISGSVQDVRRGASRMIEAYRDIGMRVSFGQSVTDQNHIVYGDDETFISGLPAELQPAFRESVASSARSVDEALDLFSAMRESFANDPMVAIQLAPDNLHWCSDQALNRVRDLSHANDVPMHMHLLETPYQKAYALERCGGHSAVEHLSELEMLGPHLTLGHGVWTSFDDLDLLAASGTRICHNCSSNFRLRSGTAPVNAMLERGIAVAIGIDEAGVNDDRDMLQELRMVLRTHRVPGFESRVPSPAQVFRMGSEFGALSTGFGEQIGVLETGRSADLVAIRFDQLSFPYLDADVPIIDAVVQRARSQHIDLVMVAGEVILESGEFTQIDEQAALAELAMSLREPPTEKELERRRVSRAAIPYVEAFYRNYLAALDPQPYYRMSSKH